MRLMRSPGQAVDSTHACCTLALHALLAADGLALAGVLGFVDIRTHTGVGLQPK
jgi:hypothetical protein